MEVSKISKFGENFLVTDLVAENFEESDEEKNQQQKSCRDLKDLPKFPSSVAIHVREKKRQKSKLPFVAIHVREKNFRKVKASHCSDASS